MTINNPKARQTHPAKRYKVDANIKKGVSTSSSNYTIKRGAKKMNMDKEIQDEINYYREDLIKRHEQKKNEIVITIEQSVHSIEHPIAIVEALR